MSSVPLLPCLLLLLSLMSFCLLFTCYFVFTYSVPLVIMSSIPLLPCLLLLLSLMSLCLLFICYFVFTYSVPYVIMSSFLCYNIFYYFCPLCLYVFCLSVTLSLHTLSLMSLCLPFLCYHVFYYFCPLCLSVFCSPVTLSLHSQSLMSFCHSGLISVKDFYKLTNLSRNSKQKIGQYLPFLSRTFRKEVITIKNTIVYKIK